MFTAYETMFVLRLVVFSVLFYLHGATNLARIDRLSSTPMYAQIGVPRMISFMKPLDSFILDTH